MERDPSQPTECVRPGPEPALDLHLGSECEPQQPMPLVKELLGLGMGGTQHNHCNLMDQKRPWGKKPAQTESKLLGRAPLCQGPLRKRLLPSPGSSCVWKCPHSEQAGQDTGTGSNLFVLIPSLGGNGVRLGRISCRPQGTAGLEQAGQRGEVSLPSPGLTSGLPGSFLSFLSSRASAKSKSIGSFSRKQDQG